MKVTAACDFFVVPTLTFKMLYVFVVLSHDRRRIVHVGVTTTPPRNGQRARSARDSPAMAPSRSTCSTTETASMATGSTTRSVR
jgi:hypothetical protein